MHWNVLFILYDLFIMLCLFLFIDHKAIWAAIFLLKICFGKWYNILNDIYCLWINLACTLTYQFLKSCLETWIGVINKSYVWSNFIICFYLIRRSGLNNIVACLSTKTFFKLSYLSFKIYMFYYQIFNSCIDFTYIWKTALMIVVITISKRRTFVKVCFVHMTHI